MLGAWRARARSLPSAQPRLRLVDSSDGPAQCLRGSFGACAMPPVDPSPGHEREASVLLDGAELWEARASTWHQVTNRYLGAGRAGRGLEGWCKKWWQGFGQSKWSQERVALNCQAAICLAIKCRWSTFQLVAITLSFELQKYKQNYMFVTFPLPLLFSNRTYLCYPVEYIWKISIERMVWKSQKRKTFPYFGMIGRWGDIHGLMKIRIKTLRRKGGVRICSLRSQDHAGEPRLRGAYARTARRPQYFPNTFVLHLFSSFVMHILLRQSSWTPIFFMIQSQNWRDKTALVKILVEAFILKSWQSALSFCKYIESEWITYY